jgi:hypothetical protein
MTITYRNAKSLLLALGVLGASSAMAALPTSGTCGFITTLPHPEINFTSSGPGTLVVSDILGTINFSTSTISYNATTFYFNGSTWVYGSVDGSETYTVGSALTYPSGAYPVTFTISGSNTFSVANVSATVTVNVSEILNLLPTNSGNTVLIQGGTAKTTGVCQLL